MLNELVLDKTPLFSRTGEYRNFQNTKILTGSIKERESFVENADMHRYLLLVNSLVNA